MSNFAAWQIGEVNATADRVGCPRPVVAQQLCNLLARRVEDEYLEFARATGLSTMVYDPLGGSKVEHLRQNVEAAARGPLPDDVLTACAEVGTALRGPMPAYNR